MWDILIITSHYTPINIKIQTLLEQLGINHKRRVGSGEGIYQINDVEIRVKPCRNADSVICLRGYKADAVFVEEEWLAEDEVKWSLARICRHTIYTIKTLESILKGALKNVYDYKKAMIQDIKNYVIKNDWVEKNYHTGDDYSEMLDRLYDELWDKDEITGNGLNYYNDEKSCAVYVMENLPLYFEAAREFNSLPMTQMSWEREHAAQHMDATIRCYLLRDCLEEACEEL